MAATPNTFARRADSKSSFSHIPSFSHLLCVRKEFRSMAGQKYVYSFGPAGTDGDTTMRNFLGGKGANLAEMAKIGLPVPPGFTLSTDVCTYYYANGRKFPPELKEQVTAALKSVEKQMGCGFGDSTNPLLLACRSGARDSMPGMMDTVL